MANDTWVNSELREAEAENRRLRWALEDCEDTVAHLQRLLLEDREKWRRAAESKTPIREAFEEITGKEWHA